MLLNKTLPYTFENPSKLKNYSSELIPKIAEYRPISKNIRHFFKIETYLLGGELENK